MSARHLPLLLLVLVVVLPGQARGTVTLPLDDGALARQASAVVRGRVVAQSLAVLEGRYWTDTTVQVIEVLKGSLTPGGKLLVRQPGGQRQGLAMRVAGAATFQRGEEVLLFVRWAAGRHYPVGMAQGKYSIHRDARGEWARRDLSGLAFASFDASGRMSVHHAEAPGPRSLAGLRATILRLVGGGR